MQLLKRLGCSGLGSPRPHLRKKALCAASLSAYRASTYGPRGLDSTSHGAPQLQNRTLNVNPLEAAGHALDRAAQRLDLTFSNVEQHTGLGAQLVLVQATLISITCGLGVSVLALIKSSPVCELLLDVVGQVPGTLSASLLQLCALLLAAPLALAHLRLWTAANRVQQASQASSGNWAGSVLAAARLGCLAVASHTVLHAGAAALTVGSLAVTSAWWLTSILLLPPLLPQLAASKLRQVEVLAALLPAAPNSSQAAAITPPQAAMCIADAAFLALLLPLPLVGRAAATAIMAAGLFLAVTSPLMTGRLTQHTVAPGDEISVHVSVQTDNGITVDSTFGGMPLRFKVGEAMQQLQGSSPESADGQTQAARLCAILGDMRGGVEGAPESSSNFSASSRIARFKRLADKIDTAVVGALQGETKTLSFYNPPLAAGGFVNPSLTWWQATEDMQRKFKTLPKKGQTFFYPIDPDRPGDWVPVRVGGINSEFVELDANWAIEDNTMKLAVWVEELVKQQ